jgi:hypothetical protein
VGSAHSGRNIWRTDAYPEDARRIDEIYKIICDAGLVDGPTYEGYITLNDIVLGIRAREMTMQQTHSPHQRTTNPRRIS